MRKNLTKKLFLSVLTLAFAVISLGASTYAWFTMSKNAQINAFEAEVQAGEGIEIAVTATNELGTAQWYTGNVPASVVETAYKANGFTAFAALTTTDSGTTLVNYEGNEAPAGGYIKFYVHIKTAKTGTVNLSQIKLGSSGAGVSGWTSDAAYKLPLASGLEGAPVAVGQTVSYKVEDAARIYVNKVIYEKETNMDGANNNLAGVRSQFGAFNYYNSKNPNAPLEQRTEDVENADGTKKLKNYLAYNATTLKNTNFPAQGETAVDNVTDAALGTTTEAGQSFCFEVKIWIEGWDSECLNAIFAQKLKVQFGVSLVE